MVNIGVHMSEQPRSTEASEAHTENIPAPSNKVFYPALDGLRFAAAFLVFIYHYFSGQHVPHSLQWGWIGVNFFFVLSGFLITGILFDSRCHPHRLRNFYIRRSLRIFPLYYGVLAILLLTTPVFHWAWNHEMAYWPLYLGNYVENFIPGGAGNIGLYSPVLKYSVSFAHFWSLSIEEQFYVFWPFVVYAIADRVRLRNLCLIIVVSAPVVRLVVEHFLPPSLHQARILFFATPFRIDGLLLGGAVALMLRGPESERLQRLALRLLCGALMLFGLLWFLAVSVFQQSPIVSVDSPWVETLGLSLIDMIGASILLLAIQPGNFVSRFLSITVLRRIGQMSYGFYVFHLIPAQFYGAAASGICGRSTGVVFALTQGSIALAGTLILSYFSFRFYEAPFLRLKDRFTA